MNSFVLTDLNFKIFRIELHTPTFTYSVHPYCFYGILKKKRDIIYTRIVCVITQFLLNFQGFFFLLHGLM